jgi:hypothetical protein
VSIHDCYAICVHKDCRSRSCLAFIFYFLFFKLNCDAFVISFFPSFPVDIGLFNSEIDSFFFFLSNIYLFSLCTWAIFISTILKPYDIANSNVFLFVGILVLCGTKRGG